jgi:hypothetical protein
MKHAITFIRQLVCVISLLIFSTACEKKETPPTPQKTPTPTASGNPVTAPLDYINAAGKAQRSAQKTVETASVNQAIQMFQVQEGRNPRDLDELVSSGLLSKMPKPPYGMKFSYDPKTAKFQVIPQ